MYGNILTHDPPRILLATATTSHPRRPAAKRTSHKPAGQDPKRRLQATTDRQGLRDSDLLAVSPIRRGGWRPKRRRWAPPDRRARDLRGCARRHQGCRRRPTSAASGPRTASHEIGLPGRHRHRRIKVGAGHRPTSAAPSHCSKAQPVGAERGRQASGVDLVVRIRGVAVDVRRGHAGILTSLGDRLDNQGGGSTFRELPRLPYAVWPNATTAALSRNQRPCCNVHPKLQSSFSLNIYPTLRFAGNESPGPPPSRSWRPYRLAGRARRSGKRHRSASKGRIPVRFSRDSRPTPILRRRANGREF